MGFSRPVAGSTPMANTKVPPKAMALAKRVAPFVGAAPAGSNAQGEQMARTINKTNKVQTTYGMPGQR